MDINYVLLKYANYIVPYSHTAICTEYDNITYINHCCCSCYYNQYYAYQLKNYCKCSLHVNQSMFSVACNNQH